jgi:hypothetical protein
MKTISLSILLAAAVALTAGFAGCTPADKFLQANPSSIEMSADSEPLSVTVEASSSWVFDSAGIAEWLTLKYDPNDSNLLSVSAPANESPDERADSVVLVSGDGLTLIIPVRQLAMDGFLDISPRVPESFYARNDTVRTLTISSNLTWDYSLLLASDWIDISQGDGDAQNTLTITAQDTRTLDERRDTIVIRPLNEFFAFLADSIAIVQRGLDLLVTTESMNPETGLIEAPAAGGEITLVVLSRSPWSVRTEATAERVSIDLTEGAADMMNGIPVVVTVSPNTEAEEYAFTLVFESDDQIYEYRFVQAIAQTEEPTPEPEPIPAR